MKTSNKLLLGLIIAVLLIATIFIGLAKYYHVSATSATSQNSEKETAALSFEEGAGTRAPIFFPVALLQPLQLQ